MTQEQADNLSIEIPEGYSIGPINTDHYNTFAVFKGDKKIGRIGHHGEYYTRFNTGAGESSVTGYIQGDYAQQRGLNALVAFHKVIGDLNFTYESSFTPNVFMNTFVMCSYDVSPVFERIHFANVHHKADGWHVEQLYGQLSTTTYQSAQEAAEAAMEAAKKQGSTVLYVAGEMIKAGWVKDRAHAKELVGWGWTASKFRLNNGEPSGIVDTKVKSGDIITWDGKTWTVK